VASVLRLHREHFGELEQSDVGLFHLAGHFLQLCVRDLASAQISQQHPCLLGRLGDASRQTNRHSEVMNSAGRPETALIWVNRISLPLGLEG
jgi:hypothetical protein